jgi:hypothetical protein
MVLLLMMVAKPELEDDVVLAPDAAEAPALVAELPDDELPEDELPEETV